MIFGILIVLTVFTSLSTGAERRYNSFYERFLLERGSHVERRDWTERQKYYSKCGLWSWDRCTRYRAKHYYSLSCEDGWSNDGTNSSCIFAKCKGKIRNEACTKFYSDDVIIRRDGSMERHSGGHCQSPDKCVSCNNGFYPVGSECLICPKIAHCNHRNCTNEDDNHCEMCEGEIKPKFSWRAYTPVTPKSKKTCQKACSWRQDSNRCFPGTCADELASKCSCWNGFGGDHCVSN